MTIELSDAFCLELDDGDVVWPSTVARKFRVATSGSGGNVLGKGERPVSEEQMIDAVLNDGKISRFRSKTNARRQSAANHFGIGSRSVRSVTVYVKGVPVKWR